LLLHAWSTLVTRVQTLRTKVLFTQPAAGLKLRSILRELELSERDAAGVLHVDERVFAGWCAGRGRVPRIVWLSLAAIQIGKALGARVLATAGSGPKRTFSLAQGADAAFDYSGISWVESILAATDGRGADVIYDPVGGDVFDLSTKCIAPEGRIHFAGEHLSEWPSWMQGALSSGLRTVKEIDEFVKV